MKIKHQTLTSDFFEAWKCAVQTTIAFAAPQAKQENVDFRLIRDHLNQPFIEHFSFGFGNQLFFCCIYTDEDCGVMSTSSEALRTYATECGAIPCLLPLSRTADGGWEPSFPESPLLGITETGDLGVINLPSLISEDLIELTDWELGDWAVGIVVEHVMKEFNIANRHELNYQSTTGIYPQIWFQDEHGAIRYVVFSAIRYPAKEAPMPDNIDEIRSIADQRGTGFFASVSFAQSDGFKENPGIGYRPPPEFIYRTCPVAVNFTGLQKL